MWCCHRVSTQLRLNKYHIISYRYTSVCVRVSKQWRFGVETRIFERRFFCFLIQPYQWVLRGLSKYNENFSGRRSLQDVNVVEPPPPKSAAHPEDGDWFSARNVRQTSHLDVTVCPIKFHWILSLRKLWVWYYQNISLNAHILGSLFSAVTRTVHI